MNRVLFPIKLDADGVPSVIQYARYNGSWRAYMVRWCDGSWSFVYAESIEKEDWHDDVYRTLKDAVRSEEHMRIMWSGMTVLPTQEAASFYTWAEDPANAHLIEGGFILAACLLKACLK